MRGDALAAVDTAIEAARAYGREDLARRLTGTRARLVDPAVRVMVVGEFKQGKSSLVNAILNAAVCPVDDDVATSVPTLIRHGDEPWAGVVRRSETGTEEVDDIEFSSLPVYASELGNPGNERGLLAVEIALPRRLLRNGLSFVDTPGVGGLGSAHTAATIAALPTADLLLFVSDASQELSGPEMEILELTRKLRIPTAVVMTKTDFHPSWREIRDLNLGHLKARGFPVEIFTASALLRTKAIESNDKQLNLESGYPHLIEFIETRASEVEAAVLTAAVDDLRSVVEQLTDTFDRERQVLEDPAAARELMADFERTKERADALRDKAARWQVTLSDGVADLTADFDHRLKGRLRTTSIESDNAMDSQDPAEIWDDLTAWLRRRVSHDLAHTYLELSHRTQELSALVADHFDDGKPTLAIRLDAGTALTKAADVDPRTVIEAGGRGAGTTAMTAMRGSYGGLLMFGMMAQMAGLAMLNPATAVVGALMGRKAVKDERERQLTVRRQQAKATARQFIEDAGFEVGKEMRDSLRRLQRQLRDHYQDRADELKRSIATSLAAAKEAVNSNEQQRAGRLRDVHAELERLRKLAYQIDALQRPEPNTQPQGSSHSTSGR
ncbi:MAG: dynamin family protein [Acidimicrobiia bacterium]|nr:dynamin family protein [Acidimicrobiia bacterium]